MPIKVRVRNYQSIEDATLTIDGLTVLTGTNNAGKSAFFRALRGVFTNTRGSDFVRLGAKHCVVDVTFDDGRTLTWKKGDGTNDYVIDGSHFPNVGHGVPPEVSEFGVVPVTAGNADLWPQIAQQVTGVCFLFDRPGSVIAEAVADVDRVSQLGRALKSCESDRRGIKADIKIRRKDLTTYNERREVFAGLDEAVGTLRALEKRHAKAAKHAKATAVLVKMGERHRRARGAVEALEGLDDAHALLPTPERVTRAQKASEVLSMARHLRQRREGFRSILGRLEGLDEVATHLPSEARMAYADQFRKALGLTVELTMRYEEASGELDRATRAQDALGGIDMDDRMIERAGKYRKALGNATGLKARHVRGLEEVAELDREIADQERQLAGLDEKLSTVLGTYEECPTCGGDLDHVHESG